MHAFRRRGQDWTCCSMHPSAPHACSRAAHLGYTRRPPPPEIKLAHYCILCMLKTPASVQLPLCLPACLRACLSACVPACLRACLPACLPTTRSAHMQPVRPATSSPQCSRGPSVTQLPLLVPPRHQAAHQESNVQRVACSPRTPPACLQAEDPSCASCLRPVTCGSA
jgi:hypothetical protein